MRHCHQVDTRALVDQIRRQDGTVAFGLLWDWEIAQVWDHVHAHQLPINPVDDVLSRLGSPGEHQRVGHILDWAQLERGRVTLLKAGWPVLFNDLARLLPRLREWT